jgi:tetratricopeptide (TPR) repeat protein
MDAHGPCPDAALLAAYLDGGLADDERRAVVSHLAECPQCRAVALTVVEFREVQALDGLWEAESARAQQVASPVRLGRTSRRTSRAPAGALIGLTTVVVLTAVFSIGPPVQPSTSERLLTTATQGERVTLSRFSDFPSAPPSRLRGPETRMKGRVIAAANRVRDDFISDYGPAGRRAVGLAATLLGDLDEAVDNLAIASLAAPHDARVANDVAAAYYERAERSNRPEDLPAALDAAERAVRLQPQLLEAWFNRALALTALGLRADAEAAWREYRARDGHSVWAQEARTRQEQVAQGAPPGGWESLRETLRAQPATETARMAVRDHAARSRELFQSLLQEWSLGAVGGHDRLGLRRALDALGEAFEHVQGERFYLDLATSIADAARAGRHRRLGLAHQQFFTAHLALTPAAGQPVLDALHRASRTLEALHSPLWIRAELDLALASYYRGRHDDAAAVAAAMRRTAEARGHRVAVTRAYWIEGLAAFGRSDLPAARVSYEHMLAAARLPGDVDQFVMALVLLANVHDMLGDHHRAWSYRRAAMPLIEACETPSTRTNVLLSAAGHAKASGHRAAALLFESRALRAAEGLSPASETLARIQRAATLHHLGEITAAHEELESARQQIHVIADTAMRARRRAESLALESEWLQTADPAASLRLAHEAIGVAGASSDGYLLSRLHARVADAAAAANQFGLAEQAVDRAISMLARVRGEAGSAGPPSDHELPLYIRAAEIAYRRGDLARAFHFAELRRVRTLMADRTDLRRVRSLAEVQRGLEGDTALAILNQFGDQLHVWLLRRDHVFTHAIDLPASQGAALVLSQVQELQLQPAAPKVSEQLFETLFRPIQAHLSGISTLAIVADAPYSRLAFPAVWDRERGKYLVEDFRLVSAASASTFGSGREHETAVPRSPARVAVIHATDEPTSASTSRQLGPLSEIYPSTQLRTIRAATPSQVLDALTEQDVVHLATRYVGAGETSAKTRLDASDEPGKKYSGSLSAAQLARSRRVRARLVAVDAAPPEGSMPAIDAASQVTRALLAAGVATVVASTAAVSPVTVAPMWIEFHRHYASGATPAESLRRAQIAALGASARRPGPWATLTVFGSN